MGFTRQLTKALPLPVGRDRKIRTVLRTYQIARFVTVTSQKKNKKKIMIIIIIVVFDVVTITIMIIMIIINIMSQRRVVWRNFSR